MVADYVHRLNIEHYQKLLLSEADPGKRRVIERLLADEQGQDEGAGSTGLNAAGSADRPDRPDHR